MAVIIVIGAEDKSSYSRILLLKYKNNDIFCN